MADIATPRLPQWLYQPSSSIIVDQHWLIQAWPSPCLLTALADCLTATALGGRHVAVLDRTDSPALGWHLLEHVHTDPGHYIQGHGLATSPKFLAAELANPESARWLDRLGLIVVPRGEQIFRRPYDWEALAACLKDRNAGRGLPPPRFIVVLAPRTAAESALRDILPLTDRAEDWAELRHRSQPPDKLWWTIWTTQGLETYKSGLNPNPKGIGHYGAEPVLAHFAGIWNVRSSRLIGHSQVADVDQSQTLQKDLGACYYQSAPEDAWDSLLMEPGVGGIAVSLRDSVGNPWRSLQAVVEAGGGAVLANIVSKHTAFQGYFLANAQHFASQPLQPLSPKKTPAAESPLDTLLQLVRRIKTTGRLPLTTIKQVLAGAKLLTPDGGSIAGQFRRLSREHLHPAVAEAVSVTREQQWNPIQKRFEAIAYLSLGSTDLLAIHIDWLRPFRVCDDSGSEQYRSLSADHVQQTYLPGQTAVIAGRTFKINGIDWAEGAVYASHDDTLRQPDYRPSRRVELRTPIDQRKSAEWGGFPVTQVQHNFQIDKAFYRLAFNIDTSGYTESPDQWAGPPFFHPLPAVLPAREYREGRACRLRLLTDDGSQSLLTAPAANALAAWLNEAAELLFPETGRFLLAAADVGEAGQPQTDPAKNIVPRLSGECAADHSVWVFEDSNADLGLARAVVDHCHFILDLCADYLAWLLEENTQDSRPGEPACLENQILPAADFFRYGAAERDPALGFADLLGVLRQIAPWFGADALSLHRRQSLNVGEALVWVEPDAVTGQAECDFCGAAIDSGEWQTLPEDGRIRCMDCSDFGVDSLAQLQILYVLVRRFFTQNLKQDLIENIHVTLANQADLARQSGGTFIPTAGFDPRAVGLAIARSGVDARGRHEIWIESGFSPEETAATLAHELTHIWQYNHLDHEKIRQKIGNELLEGHAVWVSNAFLNEQSAHPDANFDRTRLATARQAAQVATQRDDIYGQGHALLAKLIGRDDPFIWLLRHYPP